MKHLGDRTPKRVLILDLSADGHHPTYVRWLLESELAKSSNIILASRKEMFAHPAIRSCSDAFTAHEISIPAELAARLKEFRATNLIYTTWAIGKLYRKTFTLLSQTAAIDFVIVPFLDDCLLGLAMPTEAFGATPWMTITMRTMFHFSEMGVIAPPQRFTAVRRLLFQRILKQKTVTAVLTIDPTLVNFAKAQGNAIYKKIGYLPDPAINHGILPPKAYTRQQLNIPSAASVVLLYGEITVRKGIIALLEAAADPLCEDQLHVLLAGRCQNSEQLSENSAFRKLFAQGRVHRIEGYLDDHQERAVLAASDCMWVGYTDFYLMSGVMVLSGRHGLGVVASANGLIGYLTKKHALGVAIDVSSRSSVVAALNQLVREPDFFVRAGRNGMSAFREHNPSELQRLVSEKAAQSWN